MSAFGVYVHWPYCTAICPYCDFNVYRVRGAPTAPLLAAIAADAAEHAKRIGRREASSVFLGGGTPSLLSGAEIASLLEAISRAFPLIADCEVTLEANPEDAARFPEQAAAGVTRFSLGVQALDDAALKALGRRHSAADALRAVDAAAATGRRVSLDLIYAREGQALEDWRRELAQVLSLPVEHASLYQLTIEPGTAFARRAARGALRAPPSEQAAAFYEATQEVGERAGFAGYEISNYARSAAARSVHNLLYWRSDDWIGLGPGAHGRLWSDGRRRATAAQRRPADYIDAVAEHGVGWIEVAELSGEAAADEAVLMGLRIDEGVELARIENLRGRPLDPRALHWLETQGLLRTQSGRVRLTTAGRLLADRMAAELLS